MADVLYGKVKSVFQGRDGKEVTNWLDAGFTLIIKDTSDGTRYYLKDARNPDILINFFTRDKDRDGGRQQSAPRRAPTPDEDLAF